MGKFARVLAIDLGASSGRGIVFTLDSGKLCSKVVHRFDNGAVEKEGRLYWDIDMLFNEICTAVGIADRECGRLDSIGIDTWGVDIGFVGKDGRLIDCPRHYRDKSNALARNSLAGKAWDMYSISGISDNDFNTAYQLIARKKEGFDFGGVKHIAFMPQLLGYMLTGVAVTEPTIASTSGFYKAVDGFCEEYIDVLGISKEVFPPAVKTCDVIGKLSDSVKKKAGIDYDIPLIATAGHDTACAVAGIPCDEDYPLYISSGTWSLFGTLEDKPIISRTAFECGYTNEIALDGRIRLLKNIMGMWIIQECRRQWTEEGKEYTYPEIVELAKLAADKGAEIDVNDAAFAYPCKMADRVRDWVLSKQGIELKTEGEIALCVYKSLAKAYKSALDALTEITGRQYTKLYVIGGGSNNDYLNGLIANGLQMPVSAEPSEASALGNALGQLIGLSAIGIGDIKKIVTDNCGVRTFYPQ